MRNGRSVGGHLAVILAMALATGLGCAKVGQPEFVGRWISMDRDETWELFPDGTSLLARNEGGRPGKWTLLDDGRLKLELFNEWDIHVGNVVVDGDEMSFVIEDGTKTSWARFGTPLAARADYVRRAKGARRDLLSIGVALVAYAVDNNRYPQLPDGPVARLEDALVTTYLRSIPAKDPWGRDYWLVGAAGGDRYVIASFGADGKRDSSWLEVPSGDSWTKTETTDPNADIVFADGEFKQSPAGVK